MASSSKVTPKSLALAAMALAALLAEGARASAAPLEPAACVTVKSEHDALEATGIREQMTKGPDWARANLPAERLLQIRRFLKLEEELRFRCPPAKPAVETAADAAPAAEAAPAVKAPPAKRRKAAEKAEPAAADKAIVTSQPTEQGSAPAAKSAKPAARPKAAEPKPLAPAQSEAGNAAAK